MDSINTRKSIRTYLKKSLSEKDNRLIHDYINKEENRIGLFKNHIDIQLIQVSMSGKISTYGTIQNAPAFLIVLCKNTKEALIDCGYVFEKIVLFLEENNLGTCWLGGSFNRNSLRKLGVIPTGDEFIPVISPVGYKSDKNNIADKIIRKQAGSDSRLDFDKMFFSGEYGTKIEDPAMRAKLELVRLAPSSSNKQPWRIVIKGHNKADLYIERFPNYAGNRFGYDMQMLDMGIAAAHFAIAFGKEKNAFVGKPAVVRDISAEYVFSMQ